MTVLRKGDRGTEVKNLQSLLKENGASISPDGIFGYKTELAVKAYQRKKHLFQDGIAGRKTLESLGNPVKVRAPQPAIGRSVGRQTTGAMTISSNGMTFIYNREAWAGHSCYLHWPGGASGVTLGPGYDMKERSEASIKTTMLQIGLDNQTAEKISKAAHLVDAQASTFATNNKSTVKLTATQETALLKVTVPPYINRVKNAIFVPLTQNEFDALVSFAYNPGGRFPKVCALINKGLVSDAMDEIKRANTSKKKVVKGLVNRRRYEVDLFLNGIYAP